jgi:hypothetical protein
MNRRSLVKPGKQKRAMTQSSRTALKKRVPRIYQDRSSNASSEDIPSSDPCSSESSFSTDLPLSQCDTPLPPKKRRLCIDKHLVVGEQENVCEENMGKRRRLCRNPPN